MPTSAGTFQPDALRRGVDLDVCGFITPGWRFTEFLAAPVSEADRQTLHQPPQ